MPETITRKTRIPRLHYRHAQAAAHAWSWSLHAANGEVLAGGWGFDTRREARLSVRRAAAALARAIAEEDRRARH